jgi:hypothetical protein
MTKRAKFKDEVREKYTKDRKPPYKCKDCDYMHKSMSGLSLHWRRKHGEVQGSPYAIAARRDAANGTHAEEPRMGRPPGTKDKGPRVSKRLAAIDPAGVNFCPQCGCHLAAVRVAMSFNT